MISGGPNIETDGLIFCIDVSSNKCISPIGCVGFNDAPQLIKNLVSKNDILVVNGDVRLGNLTYYTLYGLEFSESTRTPANRDGITLGYNNTSSALLFQATRDLNYYVFDNDSMTWLTDSYFNGNRNFGRTYDTYDSIIGTSEHIQFQTDYSNIASEFPNSTHIVIGSHAADKHDDNADTLEILQDLGLPDSQFGSSRPEYILVGKPGLGKGNAFTYVFENNSGSVAHANIGLPIYGNKNNYLEFDGTNDYISLPSINMGNPTTVSVWFNLNVLNIEQVLFGPKANGNDNWISVNSGNKVKIYVSESANTNETSMVGTTIIQSNKWYNVVGVIDDDTFYLYLNGELENSRTVEFSIGSWTGAANLGMRGTNAQYPLNGKISSVLAYSRALTATEIKNNFNAKKSKFGY
jgi:hypothetical protein